MGGVRGRKITASADDLDPSRFDDASYTGCGSSHIAEEPTLHALAHLVVEPRTSSKEQTQRTFVKDRLPQVIERLYPKVAYTDCMENRF